MSTLLNVTRRSLVKLGFAPAGIASFSKAFAQYAGSESGTLGAAGGRADEELFSRERSAGRRPVGDPPDRHHVYQ